MEIRCGKSRPIWWYFFNSSYVHCCLFLQYVKYRGSLISTLNSLINEWEWKIFSFITWKIAITVEIYSHLLHDESMMDFFSKKAKRACSFIRKFRVNTSNSSFEIKPIKMPVNDILFKTGYQRICLLERTSVKYIR